MIKKIKFVPHVPGEIGEQSVIDFSSERFKVEHLHMIFDFIPDDFCTSFPVYFISQELLNEFELENISGFKDPVLISHEQNEQSSVEQIKTKYYMITIQADKSNDIYIDENTLYISEKLVGILRKFNLKHGEIKYLEA